MSSRVAQHGILAFLIATLLATGCQSTASPAEQTSASAIDTPPMSKTVVLPTPTTLPTEIPEATIQATQPTQQPGVVVEEQPQELPPIYTYRILNEYPHDPNAFTQGLVYLDGILVEGTGLYGHSSLRKVTLETGEPFASLDLDERYFGEGVAVFDDTVFQLTWKSQEGFTYNVEDLSPIGTFTYPTEGWGLTHDGVRLIMSDGTPYLNFVDPQTFDVEDRVQVIGVNGPVSQLNELEYINGEVYANVWQTSWIVRIDPATGEVVGYIDLTGLHRSENQTGGEDVLNGIAYDVQNDRLFVTGKLWPTLYEIELVEIEAD